MKCEDMPKKDGAIELEACLGAMVDRMPALHLAAEPKRNGTFVIWGLEALELAR